MSIFNFFRNNQKTPAQQAGDRLRLLLAHERSHSSAPDFLPQLQNELIQVISKYVNIDADKVAVRLDRSSEVSTLEVNIELPDHGPVSLGQGTRTRAASGR